MASWLLAVGLTALIVFFCVWLDRYTDRKLVEDPEGDYEVTVYPSFGMWGSVVKWKGKEIDRSFFGRRWTALVNANGTVRRHKRYGDKDSTLIVRYR